MPLTCDRKALAFATRLEDSSLLDREMAGLAEFLTERPTIEQLTGTFVRAFQDQFYIEFQFRNSD
jgi:hypothetical protein